MFDTIIDFLYPKRCVGCGVYGTDLCKKCFEELPIAEQICPMCGLLSPMGWTHERCKTKNGMEGLTVIYSHEDSLVTKVIENIKFGFNKKMVSEMLRGFQFESGAKFDWIVPVPLHFYRENWRGFNQAEEIGRAIGKGIRVEVKNILKRNRKTRQQALLTNREEREKNIRGAFELYENGLSLKGKRILLVDDVFTSGADMRECTKVLKKAGVKMVWGLALAH